MIARPPTPTLFPYTTLFRSSDFDAEPGGAGIELAAHGSKGNISGLAQRDFRQRLQPTRDFVPPSHVPGGDLDRKSTRLNSSHTVISYAVFCLKKKKQHHKTA